MAKNLNKTNLTNHQKKALKELEEILSNGGCPSFEDPKKLKRTIRRVGYGINSAHFVLAPNGENVRTFDGKPIRIHHHTKAHHNYFFREYLQSVINDAKERYPELSD